ncbi:MAG: DinB family protein [Armatimonadetes bacterium]|nr:DinB family protein [Armatimonadota bacterium]
MSREASPLPGYPEPYGLLGAILQDATSDWREELTWFAKDRAELDAKLGRDFTTWRVRSGGQTAGAVILHMIIAELYWFEVFALDREVPAEDKALIKWSEINVDEGKWPEPPAEPLSWYFDLQDRFRTQALEAVKSWPSAATTKIHHGNPVSYAWVFGHVIQHESYHGGQILLIHDLWQNR